MDLDWTHELVEQVDRHWRDQLRPRYDRLSDEEYLWEPVANSWNLHPRGQGRTEPEYGGGRLVIDFVHPEPVPAPVTTIAWRLAHVVVGVLGARVSSHFGGPPMDYQTHHYATTAADALQQLDEVYLAWREGVTALGDEGLARPCGTAEGPFAAYPMAALVLHVNARCCTTEPRSPCCATCTPTVERPPA